MEQNSKNDTLSRKALFSQLSQKAPTECHLCNRKIKIKSGYTLHLKKCSQNVNVSQKNTAETTSPVATAPPLPTSLPTIVSPTSITLTDTMTTSQTTVSTALTTSSTPTIITEVDIPPHRTDKASNESFPPLTHVSTMTVPINISKKNYKLGDYDGRVFDKKLNVIYDFIVYWKKNMLLTGRAGEDYIDEITRLLNAWIQDSAMKHITFKAIMVMSSLILQKPSRYSKAKDHSEVLRRRMILWQSGDLLQLFKEAETI